MSMRYSESFHRSVSPLTTCHCLLAMAWVWYKRVLVRQRPRRDRWLRTFMLVVCIRSTCRHVDVVLYLCPSSFVVWRWSLIQLARTKFGPVRFVVVRHNSKTTYYYQISVIDSVLVPDMYSCMQNSNYSTGMHTSRSNIKSLDTLHIGQNSCGTCCVETLVGLE
jgi:hypothetical protein